MKKPSNTKAAPRKKKPASGAQGAKKCRSSAMPQRRNAYLPALIPGNADEANLRRARMGDESEAAAQIYGLARQLMFFDKEPQRTQLACVLAGRIIRIVRDGDIATLKSLTRIIAAPVAMPAQEAAFLWRREAEKFSAGIGPRFTRKEITAAIQKQTWCNSRTAEKAVALAGLSALFKWKQGRPEKTPRPQK